MILTIVFKEFYDNIFHPRFIVGIVVSVVLTIVTVVALTHEYRSDLDDYYRRIEIQNNYLRQYANYNRSSTGSGTQIPPNPLYPLVPGVSKSRAHSVILDINPLPAIFQKIDFAFIVTVIMSLMALLFSHDVVVGERERGTLRQTFSNSFSRAKFLTGKCIGGGASLLVPFIISVCAGALYINLNPAVAWNNATWCAFFLLVAASVIFISLFYLLGLLVSTFSRNSSTSIFNGLFLWVLIVLTLPNLSPFLAARIYTVPSKEKVQNEKKLIWNERENVGKGLLYELKQEFEQRYPVVLAGFSNMNWRETETKIENNPVFKAVYREFEEEEGQVWKQVNAEYRPLTDKVEANFRTRVHTQTQITKYISLLSPSAVFTYLLGDLSGTGLRGLDYNDRITREHMDVYRSYVKRKYENAQAQNPDIHMNSHIDVSDRPHLIYKEEPLKNRVNAVLPYIGILVLFNLLLYTASFVKFITYDVR